MSLLVSACLHMFKCLTQCIDCEEVGLVDNCSTFRVHVVAGPIQCIDCGEGDLNDLTRCLEDLTPMYGLFRVTHTDVDDITTVKFVYIVW